MDWLSSPIVRYHPKSARHRGGERLCVYAGRERGSVILLDLANLKVYHVAPGANIPADTRADPRRIAAALRAVADRRRVQGKRVAKALAALDAFRP